MSFKNAKVLVTGGAGFVGSNVVDHLLKDGAAVTVLDDFSTGSKSNLPAGRRLKVVKGDVCDPVVVKRLVGKSDFVAHLAARNIIVSTKNPREDFRVNIGGTLNVLLAARDAKITRMVYSSSCSVYGNSRYLPVNEDDQTSTLSPYSVSKLAGENYCVAFFESYNVPVSVVRYSNVYGPRQSPNNPYCGVVARFIEAAIGGRAMCIHGDGEQTRDFTYVDDTVEATLLALSSGRAEGQIFNSGTGHEVAVNTLAGTICEISGSGLAPTHIDRRDIDNIRRRVVNIEKIRRLLHWVPSVSLREGLRRAYEWQRTNG
jgi:UDP-glucose 4-epimerase